MRRINSLLLALVMALSVITPFAVRPAYVYAASPESSQNETTPAIPGMSEIETTVTSGAALKATMSTYSLGEEAFVFEITTTDAGQTFQIPTNNSGSYNWDITWGDGQTENKTGSGNGGTGIGHTYATAGTFRIEIRPANSDQAWLKAFGFAGNTTGSNAQENKDMVTLVDCLLTPLMTRTTAQLTGPPPMDEWANTFIGCTNLTMGPTFNYSPEWDSIKAVGIQHGMSKFEGCTNLRMNSVYTEPKNIESIDSSYLSKKFKDCENLELNAVYNYPQKITVAVGSYILDGTFMGCKKLKMNLVLQLPPLLTEVGDNYGRGTYSGCELMEMNEIYTSSPLVSNGQGLLSNHFNNCTILVVNDVFVFSNVGQTGVDKSRAFESVFSGVASPQTRTAASIINGNPEPNSPRSTFGNAFSDRPYIPLNWGGFGQTPPTTYQFTVSAGTGGTVDGSPTGQYEAGAYLTVWAEPAATYRFKDWTITGEPFLNTLQNPQYLFMPQNDLTLVANFEKIPTYPLTITTNGGNGTVSGTANGNYEAGTYVSVTADPNGGTFLGWTSSDIYIPNVTVNPLVFAMPANGVSLTAQFAGPTEPTTHLVTIVAPENGTVKVYDDGDVLKYTIEKGTSFSIRIPHEVVLKVVVVPEADFSLHPEWSTAKVYTITKSETIQPLVSTDVDFWFTAYDGATQLLKVRHREGRDLPSVEVPAKDGLAFVGWYVKGGALDGTFVHERNPNYGTLKMPKHDLTVEARWSGRNTVSMKKWDTETNWTVIGNSDESGIGFSQSTKVRVPSIQEFHPERVGFSHVGWEVKWDDQSFTIELGDTEPNALNMTWNSSVSMWEFDMPNFPVYLVGVWSELNHALTLVNSPASVTPTGQTPVGPTAKFGANLNIHPGYARGWTFHGWDRADDAASLSSTPTVPVGMLNFTMPQKEQTIKAFWGDQDGNLGESNLYTVKFECYPAVDALTQMNDSFTVSGYESVVDAANHVYKFRFTDTITTTDAPERRGYHFEHFYVPGVGRVSTDSLSLAMSATNANDPSVPLVIRVNYGNGNGPKDPTICPEDTSVPGDCGEPDCPADPGCGEECDGSDPDECGIGKYRTYSVKVSNIRGDNVVRSRTYDLVYLSKNGLESQWFDGYEVDRIETNMEGDSSKPPMYSDTEIDSLGWLMWQVNIIRVEALPDLGIRAFAMDLTRPNKYFEVFGETEIDIYWLDRYNLTIENRDHEGTLITAKIPGQTASGWRSEGEATDIESGLVSTLRFNGWTGYVTSKQPNIRITMPEGVPVTLTANWIPYVSINFQSLGVGYSYGNLTVPNDRPAIGDSLAAYAGTREGFDFAGWQIEGDATNKGLGDAELLFSPFSNLVVTALWTPLGTDPTFEVTFDLDGGQHTGGQLVQTISKGGSAVAPTGLSKTGYTFAGWDKAFTNVQANTTIKALWTKDSDPVQTFTVTFNLDGGTHTGGQLTQTVNKGAAATAPTGLIKNGFTFAGWDKSFDNVQGNTTVKALWTPVGTEPTTFTVTFNLDGGTHTTGQLVQTVNKGATAIAPTGLNKNGFTFAGWDRDYSNVQSNITVKALWTAVVVEPTTYTVSFESNGGSSVFPIIYVAAGTTISKPADPTKGNETFSGWFKDVSLTTPWNFATDKVNSNITLFAKWTSQPVKQYTVTYDYTGGTGSPASQTVNEGISVGLPSATRDGYVLDGWYTIDGTRVGSAGNGYRVDSNITLFARWIKIEIETPHYYSTLTLSATPAGSATLSGTGTYQHASNVRIAAGYGSDWTFVRWELVKGVATISNHFSTSPYVILMSEQVEIRAILERKTADKPYVPTDDFKDFEREIAKPDPLPQTVTAEIGKHNSFISGYPDGSVGANLTMRRSEMAQVFFNLINDNNKHSATSKKFADVPKSHWAHAAVSYFANQGVLSGYQDGNFHPDDPITIAEFLTFAVKAFNLDKLNSERYNIPNTAGHWAESYISVGLNNGWLKYMGIRTFNADAPITRAQAVTLLNHYTGRQPNKDAINKHLVELYKTLPATNDARDTIAAQTGLYMRFTDLTINHWAFYEIMEATYGHEFKRVEHGEEWTK